MKYKTRKLLGRFIALLIILVLSLSLFSCAKTPAEDNAIPENLIEENNEQTEDQTEKTEDNTDNTPVIDTTNDEQITEQPPKNEDKAEPCDVTIDERFMPDQVVVTLTLEESAKGIEYTEKDFEQYGVINVFPYNDYYPEKFYPQYKNKQTLVLMLEQYSKQAVLDCVKKLEQDSRVYSSEPCFMDYSEQDTSYEFYMVLTYEEFMLKKIYTSDDFPQIELISQWKPENLLYDNMKNIWIYNNQLVFKCTTREYECLRELVKDERVERIYYYSLYHQVVDLEHIYITPENSDTCSINDFPDLNLKSVQLLDNGKYCLTVSKPGYREYFNAFLFLRYECDNKYYVSTHGGNPNEAFH